MPAGMDQLTATGDLAAFVAANGWTYSAQAPVPASGEKMWESMLGGNVLQTIVRLHESAMAGNVLNSIVGDGWQVGHIVGGGTSSTTTETRGNVTVRRTVTYSTPTESVDLGFLAITMPRDLPHIILDAKGNDDGRKSSLQRVPRHHQRVNVGGEFARHFTLYAPKGYELDALYVLSPRLMALLIDQAGDLDVEIRDNFLFVYRPGGFDLKDPAVWQRFEQIRATLGALTWEQTDGYEDVRTTHNKVGAEGRRLRFGSRQFMVIGLGFAGLGMAVALGVGIWLAVREALNS